MDEAIRLARYNVRLIAITLPANFRTPGAVGLLLVALNPSDPVSSLITILLRFARAGQRACRLCIPSEPSHTLA